MRKFSSYGSIDTELHYYVPRQELIDKVLLKLIGEKPEKDGHCVTVWAPQQRGKTWIMQQVLFTVRDDPEYEAFDVVYLSVEYLKTAPSLDYIVNEIAKQIAHQLAIPQLQVTTTTLTDINTVLHKPLILILDEFDTLPPEAISGIVSIFRNIYLQRQTQTTISSGERDYFFHGVALIGIQAVLGIEDKKGVTFNVQQSLPLPNLTFAEVDSMFHWYERESGQQVDQAVIDRVFYETNGQSGLVSWLGKLLTVDYNKHNPAIVLRDFEIAYAAAIDTLPHSNIVNLINNACQEPYQNLVLKLFETEGKPLFHYDDPKTNFLYMNGVIDWEQEGHVSYHLKFSCPFVQKRLFNHFATVLFSELGRLYDPLANLEDVFTPQGLHLQSLLKWYEAYLQQNSSWLFKDAPRSYDLRLYEAVYYFNFYKYLSQFLQQREGIVRLEFPSDNGQIDLMIECEGQIYGLALKNFANKYEYSKALKQAAGYAHQLQLTEITLLLFIEAVDDQNRAKYEVIYHDARGIRVVPVFVVTGSTP